MSAKAGLPIKALASFLILALFIWGAGKSSFLPSLRLLQDTQWDFSLIFPLWTQKIIAFLWLVPVGLGFWGWTLWIKKFLLESTEEASAFLLGVSISIILFSLFLWGLAINGIFFKPITALFFLPPAVEGWKGFKGFSWRRNKRLTWLSAAFCLPVILWAVEYLSAPIVWDAVLDHFRYAREISRLHQIPLQWSNHTGDMPKASELIWAGFWNLGGETLSRLSSSFSALLMIWLFWVLGREWKGNRWVGIFIFLCCPFFLAVFSWGYVEGFLAFFEILALYCFWKSLRNPKVRIWARLTSFLLGTAMAVKYTAVLAIMPIILIWFYEKIFRKNKLKGDTVCWAMFVLPVFPWLLKGWMAYGNPFYPLATSVFGASVGYSPQMENELWKDTGLPVGAFFAVRLATLLKIFFTSDNGVAAAFTPLVAMSLPWAPKVLKNRLASYLFSFVFLFFTGWALFCSNLRHATVGAVVLALLGGMIWNEALRIRSIWPKWIFGTGSFFSVWLLIAAQLNSTAPYAQALGMEDSLKRLKRNYSFSLDTYAAYRFIERNSGARDKVVAFAVFQTYPLQRTAFVDFKWKAPVFLEWASTCRTAEDLAALLERKGVTYFLYQKSEAMAMSTVEKDFRLEGMPTSEYVRFWRYFMELAGQYENTFVYRVRTKALNVPQNLIQLPGIQERWLSQVERWIIFQPKVFKEFKALPDLFRTYPRLASGLERRAYFACLGNGCDEALWFGQTAADLGLQSDDLYDTMYSCLWKRKKYREADVWAERRAKHGKKLAGEVADALNYYRSIQ